MDQRKSTLDSELYWGESGKRGFSLPMVNSIPPMPPTKPPREEEEPEQRSEKLKTDTSINNNGCPCLREEKSSP